MVVWTRWTRGTRWTMVMCSMTSRTITRIGMFTFITSFMRTWSIPPELSLPREDSEFMDTCPDAPSTSEEVPSTSCAKSDWDMLSVAVAMYKLYWMEAQQQPDYRPTKRGRFEVMPPLRRENTIAQISSAVGCLASAIWDFLTLIITLLPKLGARAANILAMVVMVFIALYIFISRGFGDYLVRATQMAVIGFIFPNSTALVKEF
jgi:hypothetical protein